MSIITFEILVILLLIVINGIFAMSEIAMVSARKARLRQWADAGNQNARLALDIARTPGDFLSTVQVGITLIGVLAGAFGGATVAQVLSSRLSVHAVFAPYAETIAVAIVVLAITYVSLILGELVPKQIALNNPERIAAFVAKPMRALARISSPIVWVLSASTKFILWIFRLRPTTEPGITEDEIRILIRQGTEEGVIEHDEREIVDRVFRMGARRSSTMMTARKNLTVLFVTDSRDEIYEKISRTRHTLFPLCEGTLDNVLGVVRTQDILVQILGGRAIDLRAVVTQPLFLPESLLSLKLLEAFRTTGNDTALLLDEYGGLQGLITPSDVLQAVMGEVTSLDTPKAVLQPDGSWLVDGMLPLDELKETLKLERFPDQESFAAETVGGLTLALFDRIPSEGETVEWDRYQFKVLDMDGLRIDKIVIAPLERGA